ncbi:DUF1761 domain-containing protein [Candidatus Parcubacteria bacterium]|nr:MAG: DUF1761 domain-containing protein [Candidatus Parcubacteria bacterium]
MIPINLLAVIGAAAAAIVLGFLWYGPVFGKKWMQEAGLTEEKLNAAKAKGMGKTYTIMVVSTLIMSYVLAHSLLFANTYLNTSGVSAGLQAGFWNWLGYVVPVSLGAVLWDGKSWTYWFITAGYYLASLLAMGVILALWV